MKNYKITFTGRLSKAIGKTSTHRQTVKAESQEAAVLKLYDRFEHITIKSIKP